MTSFVLSKEEASEVAARCFSDPHFFCKFFLNEWFFLPMPAVHRGVLAVLTKKCNFLLNFDEDYTEGDLEWIIENFTWKENPSDPDSAEHPIFSRTEEGLQMVLGRYTLIMMPRGMSKTTLVNAANLYIILFQECQFPVYLSEAQTHASRQLMNVTGQLTSNQRIKAVFGNIRPEQRTGLTWSESEGLVQTTTGVSIAARGRGAQIRGLNINAVRPDRIIVDDVEDKESVATADQRQKGKEWFYGDVMPAMNELNKDATIVALGTLLGPEALLNTMASDPEWNTIIFGVLDKKGNAVWPAWMNLDKIESKKQSFAVKGLLHIFYLEFFNQIRAPERQKFKPEHIIIEPVSLEEVPFRAMVLDPAISKRAGADFAAISVVGMRDNGIIQILDTWGKVGATPREQIDMYFELHFRWQMSGQRHGVESISWQAALLHLIPEEMFRQGKTHGPSSYFEVIPITHSGEGKKTERVEGILQPRYSAGYVRHQKRFPELETQLLDWPLGKKDFPDATAMAVSLLDDVASVAGGEKIGEDEMAPLEEVMGGDWRAH